MLFSIIDLVVIFDGDFMDFNGKVISMIKLGIFVGSMLVSDIVRVMIIYVI